MYNIYNYICNMSNTYHKVKSHFTIKLYSKGKNVGKLPIVTLQIFSGI